MGRQSKIPGNHNGSQIWLHRMTSVFHSLVPSPQAQITSPVFPNTTPAVCLFPKRNIFFKSIFCWQLVIFTNHKLEKDLPGKNLPGLLETKCLQDTRNHFRLERPAHRCYPVPPLCFFCISQTRLRSPRIFF